MSLQVIKRSALLLVAALSALAIFSSAAFAAGKPVISSAVLKENALNTAWLSGSLDPNGATTTYKVEYGPTAAYGSSTPTFSSNGTEVTMLGNEVVGLAPLSTYHYRVSATNSFGTTVTEDATLTTTLSWRVEGTVYPVIYEDAYKGGEVEGGKIEFRGVLLKKPVRIYCRQSGHSIGILGYSYSNLQFNNGCFTQVDGVIQAACKPKGITIKLNGNLAQKTTTKIETSELCSVGEEFQFSAGGYGLLPVAEAVEQKKLTMAGTTYFAGLGTNQFETVLSINTATTTGSWKLIGEDVGRTFGIS